MLEKHIYSKVYMHGVSIKISFIPERCWGLPLVLRIDTGGWSVIYCALFNEVPTKCSLANYHTLYVIK